MKRLARKFAAVAVASCALVSTAPAANAVPSNLLGVIQNQISNVVSDVAGSGITQRVSPLNPEPAGLNTFVVGPQSSSYLPVAWYNRHNPQDLNAHSVNLNHVGGTVTYSRTGKSVDAGPLLSLDGNQVKVFIPSNAAPGRYDFQINLLGTTPDGVPVGGQVKAFVYVSSLPIPVSVPVPSQLDGLITALSS